MRLPKPITRQTLFQLLYKDKVVVILQVLLVAFIVYDFIAFPHHFREIGFWYLGIILIGGLLAFTPLMRKSGIAGYHFTTYLLYNLMYDAWLVFVIPIDSPYYLLSIIVLYSATHWYGTLGFLVSYVAMMASIVGGLLYQTGTITAESLYQVIVRIVVIGVAAGMMERMAGTEQRERMQLINVSREAVLERKRLTSLINSMADAVIATDDEGKIVVYNGASLDLLNTNVSLSDKPIQQILEFRDEHDNVVDVIKTASQGAKVVKRDDLYFLSNEGVKVRVYIDVAPIRFEESNKGGSGYIMLLRDITKEKSLDEERSEFISVTSYELRTPIAIAEANISTALVPAFAEKLPKNVKELLEQAHGQVLFLADLVNDLTTLARAERNDLDVELVALNPAQLVQQLADNYRSQAEDKKLTISVDSKLPQATVNTSELYVREVLQNFITNAIKYTEKGGVTLGARATDTGSVVFSVKDTGIGISSTDKQKIFSKFYRAEDYRTRKTRGTGLGLYITVKLAERVRGRIWYDSKLNEGSIFYLDVPNLTHQAKAPVGVARRFRSLVTGGK